MFEVRAPLTINRLSRVGGLVLLSCLTGTLANGQSTHSGDTFEVASVKVATSGLNGYRGGCRGIDTPVNLRQAGSSTPLGRCVITDARLSHLIGMAFDVSMQALNTGPDWIQRGDLRFDVQATAENPTTTTEKQLRTMLQNLLIERFQLKFHYEETDTQGFVLTVAKNGPKLKDSTGDDGKISFTGPHGEAQIKPDPSMPITMTARKCSVRTLVDILSSFGAYGPGVDKTGLTGEYDFVLSWDNEGGPALSTALSQQLGLQMKTEKVPFSTFVVDSAQKPSAN